MPLELVNRSGRMGSPWSDGYIYLSSSRKKAEALGTELSENGGKAKGYKSDASKFDVGSKASG